MTKYFKRLGAAVIVGALLLVAGCSPGGAGKTFVTVNNVAYKEEEMYANIYYSMGNTFSGIIEYDETATAQEIKKAIDELEKKDEDSKNYVYKQKVAFVKQKISDQKLKEVAKEQNITLNEEEQKKADEDFASLLQFFESEDTLTQIKQEMFKDSENADNEAKQYLKDYKRYFLSLYNVKDFNALKQKYQELTVVNKVLELQENQVADDEEYIKKYYNEQVEAQKKEFTEDLSTFDTAYDYGEPICYYPAGMRYVRQILVKFTDKEKEELTGYETKVSELEAKENRSEQENTELAGAKAKVTELTSAMDAKAKARADEAYGKITGGTDFEEVLKEYNDDASMTDESSPYAKKGYLISKSSNMVEEFLTVAMALSKPGDVSKPVKSTYGYHIIKYVENSKEGVVPYEEIRDQLLTVAMQDKKKQVVMDYYDSLYEEMIKSGKVVINYEALGFDKETYDKQYAEMMEQVTNPETK